MNLAFLSEMFRILLTFKLVTKLLFKKKLFMFAIFKQKWCTVTEKRTKLINNPPSAFSEWFPNNAFF